MGALSLGRLWGPGRLLEDRLHLRQDCVMPGLLSRQDVRSLRWKADATLGRPKGMRT